MTNLSRLPRLRSVNRQALLALSGAGLFLAALDAYVVVAALLPMLKSVNVAINHLERATPIITGFLLGYLAVMPLAGGLSDRFGRVRVYAACLGLFALGSLVTATAGSLEGVIAGRLLQGAGGGALVPVVLALAADLYPTGGRSAVLGLVSALQEVGSVLGPLWGGVLTAAALPFFDGWRWIFWLNLLAAGALLWALWPGVRARPAERTRRPLDWLGVLLAGAGLAVLTVALYGADPSRSPVGAGFLWQLPLALILFALFVLHELRIERPLIEVRHFRDSSFSGAALTNAVAGAGLMIALVFIPVLAESPIFSMDPRSAAFLLFRFMLGIPIGALAGGFLAARLRSYRSVAALGMALAAVAFFLLARWDQRILSQHLLGTALPLADFELFLAGLGLGLEIAPVSAALLDVVGESERGAGASFLVIMRLVGMLVGFSVLAGYGLYHFNQVTAHLQPPVLTLGPTFGLDQARYLLQLRQAILDEYRTIFSTTAVIVMAGAVIAAGFLRPPARTIP